MPYLPSYSTTRLSQHSPTKGLTKFHKATGTTNCCSGQLQLAMTTRLALEAFKLKIAAKIFAQLKAAVAVDVAVGISSDAADSVPDSVANADLGQLH